MKTIQKTIYSESFKNEDTKLAGVLMVIENDFGHCILARVNQEYPQGLVAGTREDCRRKWRWAKEWMETRLAVTPPEADTSRAYRHILPSGCSFTGD
jgi:hypothetical protein